MKLVYLDDSTLRVDDDSGKQIGRLMVGLTFERENGMGGTTRAANRVRWVVVDSSGKRLTDGDGVRMGEALRILTKGASL